MLHHLQQHLLSLHAGSFEPEEYLLPWITPAIADLLLEHGVESRPIDVEYGVGRALDCHRASLEYVTANASASAYFGFSLSRGVWWLHSWVVNEGGVVLDSGPPTTPALYFGVPWGHELYTLIPKASTISADNLPPVLASRKLRVPQTLLTKEARTCERY